MFISSTSGSQSLWGIWANVKEVEVQECPRKLPLHTALLRLLCAYNRRQCERLQVLPSLDSGHYWEAMQKQTVTSVSEQTFPFLSRLSISEKGGQTESETKIVSCSLSLGLTGLNNSQLWTRSREAFPWCKQADSYICLGSNSQFGFGSRFQLANTSSENVL